MTRALYLMAALLLLFLAVGPGEAWAHAGSSRAEVAAPRHSVVVKSDAAPTVTVGANHGATGHDSCNGACIPCCAAACGAQTALSVASTMPMSAPADSPEPPVPGAQGDGLQLPPPSPPPRA